MNDYIMVLILIIYMNYIMKYIVRLHTSIYILLGHALGWKCVSYIILYKFMVTFVQILFVVGFVLFKIKIHPWILCFIPLQAVYFYWISFMHGTVENCTPDPKMRIVKNTFKM